jgi:hypothetical protein
MARKGLLDRRLEGAVVPEKQFNEKGLEKVKIPKPSRHTSGPKKPNQNQQVSIKIPEELKRDLDVLKGMEKIKFDYEVVQLLVDSYTDHLSPEGQRRFTVLRENL